MLPGLSANAVVGKTFVTPAGDLGALCAFTWSTDTVHTDNPRQLAAAGEGGTPVITDDLDISSTERSVTLGAVLGLSLRPVDG